MRACPHDAEGRQRFRVYVFETAPGVLYVGLTALPVARRLRQHERGTGQRSTRRHHVRRRMRKLEPKTVCATRERAEGLERRTAARLRARGWEVHSG